MSAVSEQALALITSGRLDEAVILARIAVPQDPPTIGTPNML
jgi:hypothetical protein